MHKSTPVPGVSVCVPTTINKPATTACSATQPCSTCPPCLKPPPLLPSIHHQAFRCVPCPVPPFSPRQHPTSPISWCVRESVCPASLPLPSPPFPPPTMGGGSSLVFLSPDQPFPSCLPSRNQSWASVWLVPLCEHTSPARKNNTHNPCPPITSTESNCAAHQQILRAYTNTHHSSIAPLTGSASFNAVRRAKTSRCIRHTCSAVTASHVRHQQQLPNAITANSCSRGAGHTTGSATTAPFMRGSLRDQAEAAAVTCCQPCCHLAALLLLLPVAATCTALPALTVLLAVALLWVLPVLLVLLLLLLTVVLAVACRVLVLTVCSSSVVVAAGSSCTSPSTCSRCCWLCAGCCVGIWVVLPACVIACAGTAA